MRTVVDASVALKWYFEEPGREAADAILAARIAGERHLLAPDLVVPEFANALWKKTRRGECSADDAAELWELWERVRWGTDMSRRHVHVLFAPMWSS